MLRKIAVLCTGVVCLFALSAQTPPTAPPPLKKIRVSPEVLSRILEKENLPAYPDAALQQHIQGQVTVKVLVDPTGHVTTAELLSGNNALADASLDAARGFQFHPYRLNGEAIFVESQISLEFSIKGHGDKAKVRVAYLK